MAQSASIGEQLEKLPTTYVAVSSLVWTSIVRAKALDHGGGGDACYFLVPVDCRRRLLPDAGEGYFGNCLSCWRSPRNRHAHNSLEHSTGAQGDSNGDERPGRNDGMYVGDFISWTWQTKRNSMGATNRQESRRSHDLPLRP